MGQSLNFSNAGMTADTRVRRAIDRKLQIV
jgi:hypothetical protein